MLNPQDCQDEFGKYLGCPGHRIGANRFYKDGLEVEGVEGLVKTNREGEALTYPSGDYILLEEMTMVIG